MARKLAKGPKIVRRYVIPSDSHDFVGRVFDLAMPLHLGFGSEEQLALYPDCLYVVEIEHALSLLTRRVESLNHVGNMLWPRKRRTSFADFPVSRYEWLNAIADVFLMRMISVTDCAAIVANCVCNARLDIRKCSIDNLRKAGVSRSAIQSLEDLHEAQGTLRAERNSRFHHGYEREFTDDDTTFKLASLFEHRGGGLHGHDRHGWAIDVQFLFQNAVMELRKEFNSSSRVLSKRLNTFYSLMSQEFETRFRPLYRGRKLLPWESQKDRE